MYPSATTRPPAGSGDVTAHRPLTAVALSTDLAEGL
jgi:hypothetical protein